jgi:hypothetical protein
MKGHGGPAQPLLTLGDVINGRYRYLEVKCDGCGHRGPHHQWAPKGNADLATGAVQALQPVLGGAATLVSAAIWADAAKQGHDE